MNQFEYPLSEFVNNFVFLSLRNGLLFNFTMSLSDSHLAVTF
ncbi:hypothetical protein NC99_00540 [Sunxiuqinia dokdonensis]|uniref:Uncharacterized protein n=1 Tax=Sunxiuqinia dokdonensis TaxID=1409788 RepID=A0A0L8VF83_9BACT|nr:hypothetical protein NC99_00540 [Sunxiuqinia dokdonensis]